MVYALNVLDLLEDREDDHAEYSARAGNII